MIRRNSSLMRFITYIIFCTLYLISINHTLLAQWGDQSIMPPGLLMTPYRGGNQPKSERVIDEIQASMIHSMFTRPMFESNEVIKGEPDEDTGWVSTKESEQFTNELLSRVLAEELARQDMLKLKSMLKKQLNVY